MGLYLCVFVADETDDEVDGIEVGSYDDFGVFRDLVHEHLEDGPWGHRFPVLLDHPDSEGDWAPEALPALVAELDRIADGFGSLPAPPYEAGSWPAEASRLLGLQPTSLATWCIDVDGEPLLARLRDLADTAHALGRPISFQ